MVGWGGEEMARAFNNGLGMVLVVGEGEGGEEEVRRCLEEKGERVWRVGRLVERMSGSGSGSGGEGCVLLNLGAWDRDGDSTA